MKIFDISNPRRAESILTTNSPVWRARYTVKITLYVVKSKFVYGYKIEPIHSHLEKDW